MKTFFGLFIIGVLFTSCSDVEPAVFNGEEGNETLISFSRSVYNLPVERDGEGSVEIVVNASTLSSVDRTFSFVLIPNESSSAANPATYTLPGSVTIPAGSYQGFVTITGVDNNMVDGNIKTFAFEIPDADLQGYYFDDSRATVNVYEVCPLQDEFTGTYVFHQSAGVVTSGSTDIFFFDQDQEVEVEVGDNEYERIIEANLWPAFFDEPIEFRFSLNCDGIIRVFRTSLEYGCIQDDPDANNPFTIGPAATPGNYDTTDDTELLFNVRQDVTGSCFSGNVATFTLTKVSE